MTARRCLHCPRARGLWCVSARSPVYCEHAAAEVRDEFRGATGDYFTRFVAAEGGPRLCGPGFDPDSPAPSAIAPSPASESASPKSPGIVAKLRNFASAWLAHQLNGRPLASPAQQAGRLLVCESCPAFRPDRSCDHCGCPINPQPDSKTAWADQACPVGNWGRVDGPRPAVSVVVAARDYAPFLRDSLESALRQTHPAVEVFYCDDASRDDSLAVARAVPGVTVLPAPDGHAGVCAARNRGADRATGDYLIFLDGDDRLPADYVARKLEALADEPGGWAYSPARTFGDRELFWDVPDWDYGALWDQNWINTSLIVPRELFRRAGGWREGIGTAWDWDLAIRLGRLRPGIRDTGAVLEYRQHRGSISRTTGLHAGGRALRRMNLLFRLHMARLRVGLVLSDRVLGRFPAWIDAVRRNVQHAVGQVAGLDPFPPFGRTNFPPPALRLIYTGDPARGPEVARALAAAGDVFRSVERTDEPWRPASDSEEARRWSVARFLADQYNRLLAGADYELAWLLEDDVGPPDHALWDLIRATIGGDRCRGAAAGWYRNRHVPGSIVAHRVRDGRVVDLPGPPESDQDVELAGTGCLLVFRPLAPHGFGPEAFGAPAHDWNWTYRVAGGVRLLADVGCRHYLDEARWI